MEIGKKYRMLPYERPELRMARVVDESGEDYLFPRSYFAPVEAGDEPGASDSSREWLLWGLLGAAAIAAVIVADRAAKSRHSGRQPGYVRSS